MNAVIIDDERHCIEALATLLRGFERISIVQTFDNPLEALKSLPALNVDVMFLDIDMPHLNGFELLHMFQDHSWKVVFTTAYDEYAVQAFKVNAIDYLLKPIDKIDLANSISKLEDEVISVVPLQTSLKSFNIRLKKLAIPTMSGLQMIEISDIILLESQSNYTNIVRSDASHLTSKTLKSFESLVDKFGFIRVHHSFIINPNRIDRYVKGDGGYLVMDNNLQVPVSRSKKELLIRSLNQW